MPWVDAALIKLKTNSPATTGYALYVCALYTAEIHTYLFFFCY